MDTPPRPRPDSSPASDARPIAIDPSWFVNPTIATRLRQTVATAISDEAAENFLSHLSPLLAEFAHRSDSHGGGRNNRDWSGDTEASQTDRIIGAWLGWLTSSPEMMSRIGKPIDAATGEILQNLSRAIVQHESLGSRLRDDPAAAMSILDGRYRRVAATQTDELVRGIDPQWSSGRVTSAIRDHYAAAQLATAFEELTRDATPREVGRMLSEAAEATISAAVSVTMRRWIEVRGTPQRSDGSTPSLTVVATGALAGRELSYASPVRLIFLFDSLDHRNTHHRQFYESLVAEIVTVLGGDPSRRDTPMDIDLRDGPRHEVGGVVSGFFDAVRIYESSGRLHQRLRFTKVRCVAGDHELGQSFITRLQPWIYRSSLSRADLAEAAVMARKMERKSAKTRESTLDVVHSPGGMEDLDNIVSLLQLMHGGELPSVRARTTIEAIDALRVEGILAIEEASALSENFMRLRRLRNHLWSVCGSANSSLPGPEDRIRLADALGLDGDARRMQELLQTICDRTVQVAHHVMVDSNLESEDAAAEAELVLDPDPDPEVVAGVLRDHGLNNDRAALAALQRLASETVPYLSMHRCRHFFSMIASPLLDEITRTPRPDQTLESLVEVTDSLGAKASLWELLGGSRPTMNLFVRMCAAAPRLQKILVSNPGMIDELIDSLVMDQLPSAARIDAHSIELCRGAEDVPLILRGLKTSSLLTIGVRDMLGKDSIAATLTALSDVAVACIRRTAEDCMTRWSEAYGDPVHEDGSVMQPKIVAVGDLAASELDYRSPISLIVTFAHDGQTRRRVGGRRTTISHAEFFEGLAEDIARQLMERDSGEPLYEVRLRKDPTNGSSALPMAELREWLVRPETDETTLLAFARSRIIAGDVRGEADVAPWDTAAWSDREAESRLTAPRWDASLRERFEMLAAHEIHDGENVDDDLRSGVGGYEGIFLLAAAVTRQSIESASQRPVQTGPQLASAAGRSLLSVPDANRLREHYWTLRRLHTQLQLLSADAAGWSGDTQVLRDLAFLLNRSDASAVVSEIRQIKSDVAEAVAEGFRRLLANSAT